MAGEGGPNPRNAPEGPTNPGRARTTDTDSLQSLHSTNTQVIRPRVCDSLAAIHPVRRPALIRLCQCASRFGEIRVRRGSPCDNRGATAMRILVRIFGVLAVLI